MVLACFQIVDLLVSLVHFNQTFFKSVFHICEGTGTHANTFIHALFLSLSVELMYHCVVRHLSRDTSLSGHTRGHTYTRFK